MREVFVGSEALACGSLTRARLRWNYRTIFPDIYTPKQLAPSLRQRTVGAWLWSGRNGVIAGRAAAAMHGALWVRPDAPIELIWRCGRPPAGILVRNERIDAMDVVDIGGVPVTSPERTAFDLARHLPRDLAGSPSGPACPGERGSTLRRCSCSPTATRELVVYLVPVLRYL